MNAKRKEKALKSIEGLSHEDAVYALQNDPSAYTEDEQKEIIAARAGNPKPTPAPVNPLKQQLSQFEYSGRFEGKDFLEYNRLTATLIMDQKYDFDVVRVRPIKAVRYEGVKDSPIDIVGVEILDATPIKTTRIPAKMMRDFNGMLEEGSKGQYFTIIGGHFGNISGTGSYGEYYLLNKNQ